MKCREAIIKMADIAPVTATQAAENEEAAAFAVTLMIFWR
jgi:hypothetical protein